MNRPQAAANDAAPPPAQDTRTETLLIAAAVVLRRRGPSAVLAEIADEAGLAEAEVRRIWPTTASAAQGVFAEVHRRLQAEHALPWKGYGGGIRRSLTAARSFEAGYQLLARDAANHPAWRPAHDLLRRRMEKRLRAIFWYPDAPPPSEAQPAFLARVTTPMVDFGLEAVSGWLETGDPARDHLFIRWYGQMVRDWRHNAAEFLNLDTPEQDWPFEDGSDRS